MKLKSLALGLVYAAMLYTVLPYAFILLNRAFGWPVVENSLFKLAGGIIFVFGFVFFIYLFFIFKTVGQGTPVPIEPTRKLIIRGPYKYTRNPMYLTHLLLFNGLFLYFGYPALLFYPVLAWFVFDQVVAKWEEPQLKKRFGQEYETYLKTVPRWI